MTSPLLALPEKTLYEKRSLIKEKQTPKIYNFPARIDTNNFDIFILGKFLYWQPIGDFLDVAFVKTAPYVNYPHHKKTYQMNFSYKPAFKIGLGATFSKMDDWEIFMEYLWFHPTNKSSYTLPESHTHVYRMCSIILGPISQTTAKWTLDMDMLDLLLSRSYYMGKKIVLLPHVGVKGGWIDQKYYQTSTAYDTIDDVDYHPIFYDKTTCWNIGPRMGLNGMWKLGNGFSFLSKSAVSLLFSNYRLKRKINQIYYSGEYSDLLTTKHDFHLSPVGETVFGFGWGAFIGKKQCHIDFSFTYEFQIWSKQEIYLVGNYIWGNLTMQGLTLSSQIDF